MVDRSKLLEKFVELHYEAGVIEPLALVLLMQFDAFCVGKYVGRLDADEKYKVLVNYVYGTRGRVVPDA